MGFSGKLMTLLKKLFSWRETRVFLKPTAPPPFHLEKRHLPTVASFDFSLDNLNDWIAKLPLAHTGKTAELLYARLHEMNELDLPIADRFSALERLYSVLAHLGSRISTHYIGTPFPLTERNNQLAALAREFQEVMAIGYKIIISNQFTCKDSRISTAMFSAALHRSMLYLSNVLLKSYEVYTPIQTSLWKEMHWIYRLGEQHGLHNQPNPTPSSKHKKATRYSVPNTLSGVYKQALLLALAGPYGLHQSEINKINQIAGQWQDECTLLQCKENENVFVIDLDSNDIPAPYRAERHSNLNDDRFRFFNISSLDVILDAHIDLAKTRKDGEFSANALRRLALGWKTNHQRIFDRKEAAGSGYDKIVIGLDAIHDILPGGQEEVHNLLDTIIHPLPTKEISKDNDQECSVKFFSKEVILAGKTLVDAWDVIHINMEDNQQTIFVHEPVRIVPQNCSILDQSFGGVRILWCPPESYDYGFYKSQVGQLVALHTVLTLVNANENLSWVIGVIRWMKCESKNKIEFGIQILATHVIPIFIRGVSSVSKEKRGLLVPKDSVNQTTTLIVPSSLDHPGEILMLSDGINISRRIEINERLESSLDFAIFDFTLLSDIPKHSKHQEHERLPVSPKPPKPPEKENKFHDLWTKL